MGVWEFGSVGVWECVKWTGMEWQWNVVSHLCAQSGVAMVLHVT